MDPDEVLDVIAALVAGGQRVWIDGGWGVDALLGEVTRPHDDLDLVVELEALPGVTECLSDLGFSVAENLSPVRVVTRSPRGRQVDLHPITFDEWGTGWQRGASPDGSDCPYPADGFTLGRILDVVVPCLGAELQLEHHCGYPPRARDRHDVARLTAHFGLGRPPSL